LKDIKFSRTMKYLIFFFYL